ncbi:MAG: MerR family transcriptional regulator [Syntrophomonadaceae bacterium]|mgnify:CR=1 FL=1|nr:MerR family transcriptional regulator [Syntrophomonadaceae bacterium]
MVERIYKIGEIAEILGIEQHTLRYLENTLKLRIKRNDRGDRLYTESDLDSLKLVLKLKEKGLNTTAIRMALENSEEVAVKNLPAETHSPGDLLEVVNVARRIIEQNEELLEQNRRLEGRMSRLESKVEARNLEREKKIDEFLELWRNEQQDGRKSWLSRIRGK